MVTAAWTGSFLGTEFSWPETLATVETAAAGFATTAGPVSSLVTAGVSRVTTSGACSGTGTDTNPASGPLSTAVSCFDSAADSGAGSCFGSDSVKGSDGGAGSI